MSVNFTIDEGGQPRAFTAQRLQTPLSGGGVEQWVPEDERRLTTLHATKNGEYKAADEGYYGYSTVNVSVAQADHVSGKKSDGNDYTYSVDTNGNLTETKVPTEIRITTPPDYTGPYGPGAILSFEGLTVTAYDGNGQVMQEVPFNELVFPETTAPWEPSGEPIYEATSDLLDDPVECATGIIYKNANWDEPIYFTFTSGAGYATAYLDTPTSILTLSASNDPNAAFDGFTMDESYSQDGKTVYFHRHGFAGGVKEYVVPDDRWNWGTDDGKTAWTMIYGNRTQTGGGYQVPVQWPRTGDGLVLETSFGISVVPGPGTNDGN